MEPEAEIKVGMNVVVVLSLMDTREYLDEWIHGFLIKFSIYALGHLAVTFSPLNFISWLIFMCTFVSYIECWA